jgi:hypothetical protein
VSGRVDKEDAAVNTGVRDESISHSSKLFSEVGRVLVFDLKVSAAAKFRARLTYLIMGSQHPSLLIMSP